MENKIKSYSGVDYMLGVGQFDDAISAYAYIKPQNQFQSKILDDIVMSDLQPKLANVNKLIEDNLDWSFIDEKIDLKEKLKLENKLEPKDLNDFMKQNIEMEREINEMFGIVEKPNNDDDRKNSRKIEQKGLVDSMGGEDAIENKNGKLSAVLDFLKLENLKDKYGIEDLEITKRDNKLDLKNDPNNEPNKPKGMGVVEQKPNEPIEGAFDPNESIVDRLIKSMETGGVENLRMEHQLVTKLSSKRIQQNVIRLNNNKVDSPAAELAELTDKVRCERSADYTSLQNPSGNCHNKKYNDMDGYDMVAIGGAMNDAEELSRRNEEARLRAASQAYDPYAIENPNPNKKKWIK